MLTGFCRAETEDADKRRVVAADHDVNGRMAATHASGSIAARVRFELRLLDFIVKVLAKDAPESKKRRPLCATAWKIIFTASPRQECCILVVLWVSPLFRTVLVMLFPTSM